MIESYYWKTHLWRSAKKLSRQKKQKRWPISSIVLFEKELIVTFFCIRKLIEAKKLTDRCRTQTVRCSSYRNVGKRVDLLHLGDIDEVYDFTSGTKSRPSLTFVLNQIIHSYIVMPSFYPDSTPEGILVCSDYERNNRLFHISLNELIHVIKTVARDEVIELHMRRNKNTDDFEIMSAS